MESCLLPHIWFVDDLLFICKRSELNSALDEITERLSRIGLQISPEKTEIMDSNFSKWIGFQINKYGLNRNQQVLVNINKARSKLRS